MPTFSWRWFVSAVTLLGAFADRGAAQTIDRPYALGVGPIAFGGEVAAVIGPADTTAFFNYTDYEHNALRVARLRLSAEWRMRPVLSVVGEVRSENASDVEVAALYLRWTPWEVGPLTVQVGRVPPVIGAFARRAYGRDNVVAGSPLAYQYLVSLRPDALPATADDLLRMRARGWRPSYPVGAQSIATGVPLVSASRWDTGVQLHWQQSRWELSAAVTRGSPAVPVVRETNGGLQWAGRAAARLPAGVTVGVSGARGQWIDDRALSLVPDAWRTHSTQRVWAIDAEYGTGRWLLRAEWLRSRFELPLVAAPDPTLTLAAWSGFGELRYRPHARWQVAARLDRLQFGRLTDATGAAVPWDYPVRRVEAMLGFRATRQIEARAGWQHNWRPGSRSARRGFPIAEFLCWF